MEGVRWVADNGALQTSKKDLMVQAMAAWVKTQGA